MAPSSRRHRRASASPPIVALGIALSVALGALCASSRQAEAQYNVPSQATGESQALQLVYDERPRPQAERPRGWELGASLDFLMSDDRIGRVGYNFTDIVFFRVHALVALGQRGELFAGADLLPKQPSHSDEDVVQGGLLGARMRLGKTFAAYARAQGGTQLADGGSWVSGEAAAQARVELAGRFLFWESSLGATHTQLFPEEDVRRQFWQTELLTQTGIALRDETSGRFAAWLSFGFHFPLVARPLPERPDPVTGRALDPQVRVGMTLGVLVGVNRGLDLFLEGAILDRGDDDRSTTLPILSGGSDQKRIVFGFNRRFGGRRR